MSCNGCRVLRKGCNDKCILRQSLSGIESSQAQSHATVFVAKFFGRAGLMSFLSSVPDSQRPALFQSLLFEACGRTINPVSGAVGLLWTGNWHVCQSAVESVLRGGLLHPIPESSSESPPLDSHHLSTTGLINGQDEPVAADLDLCLTQKRDRYAGNMTAAGRPEKRRSGTPNSDESDTTTYESGTTRAGAGAVTVTTYAMESLGDNKPLRLFF